PWCYIGKKRLESALHIAKSKYPHLTFDVRWRPFELNPNLPKDWTGNDKMKYYESRFDPAMVRNMIPRMKAVAEEHGVKMEYGGCVGNTLDSHRLIWKAREVGGSELQDKVVEQLFKAYFEENKSLGDTAVLEQCASQAGWSSSSDDQTISDFLSNPQLGTGEVQQEKQEYGRTFQCTGVPMFIVDGRAVLNGAQESDAFLRTFGRL
ncbi:hypothetical protein ACHAXR_000622, partial [Thalassiosira sp. AJA248-18]